jgi:hypothetical protein
MFVHSGLESFSDLGRDTNANGWNFMFGVGDPADRTGKDDKRGACKGVNILALPSCGRNGLGRELGWDGGKQV